MGFGLNGIGRNGYWPNWELDQVALDEMALDEMGLDEVAIPRLTGGPWGRVVVIHDSLRVQAFFHETVRVCHVYCNFKIGFTCRITVIFGTLKDGSLLINTLASNICFSYRNMFQNGVDALSKIVDTFLSKSSKFHLVRIIR